MASPIRIRMYRTGFGDCFLLTFTNRANAHHVLIDFGAHMHGEIGTMDGIMENIETTTGKTLDLIVATHAHRDHISGFGKFVDRFAQFTIREVWLPWTDNALDKEAAAVKAMGQSAVVGRRREIAAAGQIPDEPSEMTRLVAGVKCRAFWESVKVCLRSDPSTLPAVLGERPLRENPPAGLGA